MCGSFISRQGLAPGHMAEFLHRLQTVLSPVSLCFTQSLGIGVEPSLRSSHGVPRVK